MSYKEITKESYQATAEEFARNVADLAPLSSIEKFIQFLPLNPTIIDIGCGPGRDAKIFSENGVKVFGIDFSTKMLEIAKITAPLAEFQLMDFEEISLPPQSFDGAWAATSLLHISKTLIPQVLKGIHRILKESGYFYLSVKAGSGEGLEKDSRYGGDVKKFWSYYEESELKEVLQAAEFKILIFDKVEISHAYQLHPHFRIVCQKT